MDLAAGDCVKAGVGGSLDDAAGAFDTGGVWPRDPVSVCESNIGQYTTIHSLRATNGASRWKSATSWPQVLTQQLPRNKSVVH